MLTINFASIGEHVMDWFGTGLATALFVLLLARLRLFPMLVFFGKPQEENED